MKPDWRIEKAIKNLFILPPSTSTSYIGVLFHEIPTIAAEMVILFTINATHYDFYD